MAQPTTGDVYVSRPLTNVSVAYMQSENNFIASKVFPDVKVQERSGMYWTYPKGEWFREEAAERAPGTPSTGSGYTVEASPLYYARVYAFHKDVPDQVRAAADSMLNLDAEAARLVTSRLMLKREKLWVATAFATSVWAREVAGVNATPNGAGHATPQVLQWDDPVAQPIQDVQYEIIRMAEQTAKQPNTLVLSPYVHNQLCNHPTIIERIKYTQRGVVSTELLASLFGVDRVLVPFVTSNTAVEAATPTMAFMYGKHALLCYVPPTPSLMEPAAGYTFTWTGFLGGEEMGTRIKKFRFEELESDRVEGQSAYDMKVVATDVGCFFKDIIA